MCNNNGACRELAGGVMCPSYRVTRDERDVTRGRANTLRLAITGQLGPDALTSDEMAETLKLCVSCKACRRECPTGVDMARMKIEVQAARAEKHGLSLHDRLVGYLPRYAPLCGASAVAAQPARRAAGAAAKLSEAVAGLQRAAAAAALARAMCSGTPTPAGVWRTASRIRTVVLFADTFNRYFERENLDAALAVLAAGGYRVHVASAGGRVGASAVLRPHLPVRSARSTRRGEEAERTLAALAPFVARGVPVVGLEPSCMLELPRRDSGDDEVGEAPAGSPRTR